MANAGPKCPVALNEVRNRKRDKVCHATRQPRRQVSDPLGDKGKDKIARGADYTDGDKAPQKLTHENLFGCGVELRRHLYLKHCGEKARKRDLQRKHDRRS